MSDTNKLEAYKFHGVALKGVKGGEARGDCPFCGKEDHFFVQAATGKFQCKHGECAEKGNIYSFLQKIYTIALKQTKKADYERLSSIRDGMPWSIFRDEKIAYRKQNKTYLIPVYNANGAFANLLIYGPPRADKLIGTPYCDQHLYGAELLANSKGPVYLCEGQWDAMALRWLLNRNNIDPSAMTVVAAPGSDSFKKEWSSLLKGREVFLMYDNDTAGEKGMERLVILLKDSTVKRIHWPSEFPDKYDIRDYVSHRADKPKQALAGLKALFPEKQEVAKKRKIVRETFEAVVKDFRKHLHTDKAWEEALAVCMAVTISAKLQEKDPLWLFLVGPPGAGKTLLVESFMNKPDLAEYLSKITRPALVSGFRGEEDYSILAKIIGRCLIVKDYTAIVSLPLGVQEELYGILRDIYDGRCVVPFGNMDPKVFEGYFSMIAGVTDVIRSHNRAALGERFLKLELLDEKTHDPTKHIRNALSTVEDHIAEKAASEEFLRESVASFMERPFDERKLPKIPEWLTDRLIHLAQLGANLRAVVAKQSGELSYRPRPEIGTRFAKQLAKLARCLCWVYGTNKIDERVYKLIQRVALETVLGWDLEIIHALFHAGEDGMLVPDIGARMQLSHSGITRRLEDLQHLSIVYRSEETRRDRRGRRAYIWYLSPAIRDLWAGAKLDYAPPPVVTFKPRPGYKPKRAPKPQSRSSTALSLKRTTSKVKAKTRVPANHSKRRITRKAG